MPEETEGQAAPKGASPDGDGTEAGGKDPGASDRSAREASAEAARYRKRAQDAERKLAKLEEATKTEAERAIAQAKAEGRSEALATANQRFVAAAAISAAAGRLANPSLAPRVLDLDGIEVDDDGNVDSAEITKRLDALLESDPYLAPNAKPGTGGAGARQQGPPSMDPLERELRDKLGLGFG